MSNAEKYFKKSDLILPNSIVLVNTKFGHNAGMVKRLAACFGVPNVHCTGRRIWDEVNEMDRVPREERIKGYDMINLFWSENPFPKLHPDCVPIAVEFRPNSELLFDFKHPENATYIFGPEDGTLDRSILTRCHSFVKMDTMECLNLATAVSIVLYDRSLKEHHGLVKPV